VKTLFFIPFYYKGASGSTVNSLVQVGWTLMLEMFYYILFYISTRISQKYRHYIASLILVALVIMGLVIKTENTFVRFCCQPVMLEFIFGMFSYKLLISYACKEAQKNTSLCVIIISFITVYHYFFPFAIFLYKKLKNILKVSEVYAKIVYR
jgi:peptidoglycan/LPS O-acetylase OafA/YrhL